MTPPIILAVALGGAFGAVGRYLSVRGLSSMLSAHHAAWATLPVNVIGSLALGIAAALLAQRPGPLAAFVMTGCLGAFTTFSTFALDAVFLYRARGALEAASYVGLSVSLAIGAFLLGHSLFRGTSI